MRMKSAFEMRTRMSSLILASLVRCSRRSSLVIDGRAYAGQTPPRIGLVDHGAASRRPAVNTPISAHVSACPIRRR